MKKAMIALGLVTVMLLGVSYVYSQEQTDPPRHGWMQREKSRGQWKNQWRKLGLTSEQKVKFKELRRRFIEENAQLMGGLVGKRLELRSLWTDPKVDSQTILAKEKELRDLQSQMRDKIVQYRLEARSFLTPEQIEKFGSMSRMGLSFGHCFHHHGLRFHQHQGQGMGHSRMSQ
jgi:Spy/CpxP family protein refolding chaperone